jgi:hypothetical protein
LDDPQLVVAIAEVYESEGTEPVMLHGKPLKPGYHKVNVVDPYVRDAPLAIATDEALTVGDAVGSFVEWPSNFILSIPEVSCYDYIVIRITILHLFTLL